jgi:hypothetical protein
MRGTAQNPDVFFQSRERANGFYMTTPAIVEKRMEQFAALTGRRYQLFEFVGAPTAERVLIMMGSGCETAEETVESPSSSPLSHNVDSIRRLEDAGVAAVVMYSLFEEQIGFDSYYIDYHLTQGIDSYAESISYFPDMQSYNIGPDEYMNLIRRAKEAVEYSYHREFEWSVRWRMGGLCRVN